MHTYHSFEIINLLWGLKGYIPLGSFSQNFVYVSSFCTDWPSKQVRARVLHQAPPAEYNKKTHNNDTFLFFRQIPQEARIPPHYSSCRKTRRISQRVGSNPPTLFPLTKAFNLRGGKKPIEVRICWFCSTVPRDITNCSWGNASRRHLIVVSSASFPDWCTWKKNH